MKPSQEQLAIGAKLAGYVTVRRYTHRAQFLFDGIDLDSKRLLDIGCGRGTWAIWAALNGADRSIGIEPEGLGAASGDLQRFRESIKLLKLDRLEAIARNMEDYSERGGFDIAILHNVINHLDEEAVQRLGQDQVADNRYVALLKHLRSLMKENGTVVVADCGRVNFWNQIGLRSPVARHIEWHKHQEPGVWRCLFNSAGFQLTRLRWSPLQPFPRLTANRLVQYFTCSHFVMNFRAVTRGHEMTNVFHSAIAV